MTAQLAIDDRETQLTRRRYDRIAPIYDALEWMIELGDAQALSYPDASFDVVVATFLLARRTDPPSRARSIAESNLSLDIVKRIEAAAPGGGP